MGLFGKKDKKTEKPAIPEIKDDQESLQYEKQIHNLNTLIGNLDDQLEKVDLKVLKLDEDLQSLVGQKKIQQAKAKIAEMKFYQKQIESYENKKSVLTQMKIQMESMSIDSKLVDALKDGTKIMQDENTAENLQDLMIDLQEIFQQQSQTNDLVSQMANQNVDQSELDDELSKYVQQTDTLQAKQAQWQLNQVPVQAISLSLGLDLRSIRVTLIDSILRMMNIDLKLKKSQNLDQIMIPNISNNLQICEDS